MLTSVNRLVGLRSFTSTSIYNTIIYNTCDPQTLIGNKPGKLFLFTYATNDLHGFIWLAQALGDMSYTS